MIEKTTFSQKKKRTTKIFSRLEKTYPDAGMILKFSNPWELLVSVILSSQCTDKKVNEVTEKLFKKYRGLNDYVRAGANAAGRKEFEEMIHSTGFYHAKAKHILETAKLVKEKFYGKVPKTMAGMLTLRGVARKTANVVLGNAYNIVEGIAVDTHVGRLSQRLGLSESRDPKKIERDLMQLLPKKNWFRSTYLLIEHGRKICTAKDPRCDLCPLQKFCPSAFRFPRFIKR